MLIIIGCVRGSSGAKKMRRSRDTVLGRGTSPRFPRHGEKLLARGGPQRIGSRGERPWWPRGFSRAAEA